MRSLLLPPAATDAFHRRSIEHGYGMQPRLISPETAGLMVGELAANGLLVDRTELQETNMLERKGMHTTAQVHAELNASICVVEQECKNHLPLFGVRVFEPGKHGTDIHRNHRLMGPWAEGITVVGEAPFCVYEQHDLPEGTTLPLLGNGLDPTPKETMKAEVGACWSLYTAIEQMPHGSGIVDSSHPRVLVLFHDLYL